MLNPAKGTTTLGQVKKVELAKPPNAGKDWKGVPHGELLFELMKATRRKGLDFSLRAAHVGRNGFDLSAGYILDTVPQGKLSRLKDDWRYGLGVATSNANRYRLRFYVGAYKEAEEGVWTALVAHSFRATVRYTHRFELVPECETAAERWAASAARLRKKLDRLAAHELDLDTAQKVLVEAAMSGQTPPSRAIQALKLLETQGKFSTLDLLAAFGTTAAKNPPDVQQDQLLGFFNRVRELVSPAPVEPK